MTNREKKTDSRLIGTWRSDRRRTLKDWIWKPRTSSQKRKRVADILGHLVILFTRRKIYADFKGHRSSVSYKVLGVDANSVAIMHKSIQHIHFVGPKHYWIT